jgi:hypothetical protein
LESVFFKKCLFPQLRKSNGLSIKKGSDDHSVKHLGFPGASIEAVTKFRQISGQVLVRLQADLLMEGTLDLGVLFGVF